MRLFPLLLTACTTLPTDPLLYEGDYYTREALTDDEAAAVCEASSTFTLEDSTFVEIWTELAYDCAADSSWSASFSEQGVVLNAGLASLTPVVHITHDGLGFTTDADYAAWAGVSASLAVLNLDPDTLSADLTLLQALLDQSAQGVTHTVDSQSATTGACMSLSIEGVAQDVPLEDGSTTSCGFSATLTLVPVPVNAHSGAVTR